MDFLKKFEDTQGLISTRDIQLDKYGKMYVEEQEVESLDEIQQVVDILKNNLDLWSISKIKLQLKRKCRWGGARASIIGVPFSEGLKNVIEGKRVEKSMFYIDADLTGKGLEGRLLAYYNRRDFEIDFQLWEIIPYLETYYIHGIYNLKDEVFSHFDGARIGIDEEMKEQMKWNFILPSTEQNNEYSYTKLFRLDGNILIKDAMKLMYYYLPLEDLSQEYGAYPPIIEENKC